LQDRDARGKIARMKTGALLASVLVLGVAPGSAWGRELQDTARTSGPAESAPASALTTLLVDLLRLSDDYRQCLILDKTQAASGRDTFTAEGGASSENLDLLLADGTDRLFKHLIQSGKGEALLNAFARVTYRNVDEAQCVDFDPYYGPALEKLEEVERFVGLPREHGQKRFRPQHQGR
jgi:hypothetical protein